MEKIVGESILPKKFLQGQPDKVGTPKLEVSRFNLSPETLTYLNQAKLDLKEIQKEAPFIMGFSFFGSRMTGDEKPGSDLDCCALYDFFEAHNYFSSDFTWPLKYYGSDDIRGMEGEIDFHNSIEDWMEYLNKKNGVEVPYHIESMVDISDTGIDMNIKFFVSFLGKGIDVISGALPESIRGMVMPFSLAIGDRVYQARTKILEKLERRADGQKIWQGIVKYLAYTERSGKSKERKMITAYGNYPGTIAEAKEVFILKPTKE